MIQKTLLKAAPLLGIDRQVERLVAMKQASAIVAWCAIAFFCGLFARETVEAAKGNLLAWIRSDQTAISTEVIPR